MLVKADDSARAHVPKRDRSEGDATKANNF